MNNNLGSEFFPNTDDLHSVLALNASDASAQAAFVTHSSCYSIYVSTVSFPYSSGLKALKYFLFAKTDPASHSTANVYTSNFTTL